MNSQDNHQNQAAADFYTGTIIEESLIDNRIVNTLRIVSMRISDDADPAARWHLYTVQVTRDDMARLAPAIRPGTWYMHFWRGNDIIAVFRDATFEFKLDQHSTWQPAIEHGRSLGIPDVQLNFVVG